MGFGEDLSLFLPDINTHIMINNNVIVDCIINNKVLYSKLSLPIIQLTILLIIVLMAVTRNILKYPDIIILNLIEIMIPYLHYC